MSFRVVVISQSAKLDLKLKTLVIRQETITRIPISEIAVLILESTATSVTSAALCELVKSKVKVIFCDEKRNPISELTPYYGSHDTSLKVKIQTHWNEELKQAVWTQIVASKIEKQMQTLIMLGLEQYEKLAHYIDQLEFNDVTNREGHAAKVYFNAMFGKSFARTQDNPTNAALNYGYSLLLSAFNREIVAAGYITQIGLFHDNMYNGFNLSCDLMEIFRPIIDLKVRQMQPIKFEKKEKLELIKVLNSQVIIDNKEQYLLNAIKIYVKSVFDVLNEVENAQIKVYRNEL
ncbi:MAG: type II CRISPR-associated endonuclease Cas1 [Clostridia bacterium]